MTDAPILSNEKFNELWNLNKEFEDETQNYANTYNLLCGILKYDNLLPDGTVVTFDLIYKRYKLFHHVRQMANDGVEKRFEKKANKILPIYEYLKERLFQSETQIPYTSAHFYFWGEMYAEEVVKHHNIFKSLCQK